MRKIEGEIATLEEELDKALADNNPAEKKRIRAEIRAREEALTDAKVNQRTAAATAQAVEQVRYDALVDRAESDYPFLVPGSETFNEELTGALLSMKAGGEAQGLSSSEALRAALKTLKPMLEAAKKSKEPEDAEDPDKKKEVEEKRKAAEAAEAKRREEAVAKGAAASKAQPAAKPNVAGTVDKDVKKLDPTKLSDKDFDKLPEDEIKRLRGDSL